MQIGMGKIVACPYCGTKIDLMTLISGNTFGAERWSDNKMYAPYLAQVSPVQKCFRCYQYFVQYLQKAEPSDEPSMNLGQMDYPDWREAYEQFTYEGNIPEEDMVSIRLWVIQAYNSFYYRNEKSKCDPPKEEADFVASIIHEFIDTFDWTSVKNPLLKAELYREANEMEQCAATLSAISETDLNDYEKVIYEGIKTRMEQGDSKVFRIRDLD